MRSGDGLIVRVRFSCGEVAPAMAAEVADCAQSHGNGLLDLSARGNLQIRGVSEATWGPLIARLSALGVVDASSEAEAVRNVQISPFAGFFPDAPDVRPLARALEAALGEDPELWRLPGKFGFSIDAGAFPLGDVGADVGFEAAEGDAFWLRLAGADRLLGPVGADRVVEIARSVARMFLGHRQDEAVPLRRLRDLVEWVGVEPWSERLGVPLGPEKPARPAPSLADLLGFHARAGRGFVGVASPFGRMRAADLRRLAERAARAGAASLRLTPWRAILILGVGAEALRGLRELDVILEGDDPRLAVVACPGAPDCESSSVRTREIAKSLAPLAAAFGKLHVSGCKKGCAHPRPARATIVGNGGRFDLVLDGRADAAPILSGLAPDALAAELTRRLRPPIGRQ